MEYRTTRGIRGALLRACSLAAVALLMANCASKPTHMELVIETGRALNPDRNAVSSPLMLNFYELTDAEQFSKLDFWALTDDPSKQLGGDLLAQAKHVIVPREKQTYRILFDEKTKFLGVIGSFRNIDGNATWRYVKNLDTEAYNSAELLIDRYAIKEVE
jgi:type VI secretion system protein VasD